MTRPLTRLTRSSAVALAAALVLASCADSGNQASNPKPSVTTTPSPSSTVKVPDTVKLTAVGADLSFGDTATVIYEPTKKSGTVFDLTVKKASQGSLKDFSGFILDDYTRSSTPYYVHVTVKNVGESAVKRAAVPLWGVDAKNTLLPPATFTTTFRRCPSERLPKSFKPGKSFSTCLVYLAPDKGTLQAVSFRPNQAFDPIVWKGDIATPQPQPKATKSGGSGKKSNGKKNGG